MDHLSASSYTRITDYQIWSDLSWLKLIRQTPAMRGHHTNNYAEVTVRLYKDHVLSRCKAYNAVALVDFTLTTMESYYRHRLLAFAHSRVSAPHLLLADLQKKAAYITTREQIQLLAEHLYQVPSEKQADVWYNVDMSVGVCSCTAGMFGKCCKHQIAVQHLFSEALPNAPPVTTADRHCAAVLAIGDAAGAADFYSVDYNNMPSSTLYEPAAGILQGMASTSRCSEATTNTHNTLPCADEEIASDPTATAICADVCSLFTHKIRTLAPQSVAVRNGLEFFKKRLDRVTSESQLASFLHTAGSAVPLRYRAGAAIRVQPTSLSRRRPGITRGSKRAPSGRPAASAVVGAARRKRPRALGTNISRNVQNSKSHGTGH